MGIADLIAIEIIGEFCKQLESEIQTDSKVVISNIVKASELTIANRCENMSGFMRNMLKNPVLNDIAMSCGYTDFNSAFHIYMERKGGHVSRLSV